MSNLHFLFSSLLFLLFMGCSLPERQCPLYPAPKLSQSQIFASHDDYIFRFLLDNLDESAISDAALFYQEGRKSENAIHYHCAEDYHRPSGEPVYSITDGIISYSGKMGGYGWIVIIDHPES